MNGKCVSKAKKPDLTVTSVLVYPENPKAGEYVVVEFTIKNIGENQTDKVYWKIDTGSADLDPQSPQPLSLDVNEDVTINAKFMYSAPGSYNAMVIADPDNVVDESNENNNAMRKVIYVAGSGGAGGGFADPHYVI
jgi:subtilase family serine protease